MGRYCARRAPDWGVGGRVCHCGSRRGKTWGQDARWAGEQQEKKKKQGDQKKTSRLTSITGKLIFLRPLRGELGVDWNCMCFAGKGSSGSRCGRGCSPPKPILYEYGTVTPRLVAAVVVRVEV